MIELVDGYYLMKVVAVACGVSYVITGTTAALWGRALWWLLTHWIPLLSIDTLAFCPSCNAWWSGLVVALLTGSSLWVALQCAVVACLVAAAIQVQFGLAKADEEKIRELFRRSEHG